MLIVFQIPLADLRAFRADTVRRDRPHWPTPDAGTEFVRYFGSVRQRVSKGRKKLPWADEQTYADGAQALKVAPFTGERAKWSVAFRRLLCDGGALTRFEVGIHIPPQSNVTQSVPAPVLQTIGSVLNLPCTVRGEKQATKLLQTGKALTRLYAKATAPRRTPQPGGEVVAGRPTVLVQFSAMDSAQLPKSLDFDSDHLAFLHTQIGGLDLNVWFTDEAFGDPRDTRLALLRLSAEHQVLKYVLRDIAAGNVKLNERTERTDRLQTYLANADKTLSSASRFGIDQTELVRLTQTWEQLCGADELVLLKEQLKAIRGQITAKVLTVLETNRSLQPPPVQGEGPDFPWRGQADEVELQAFFDRPGRALLDAAWIHDVTERLCPAVCLITMPKAGRTATGFLVGKDLVLTNYHVVDEGAGDDLAANLAETELKFTMSADGARVFRLAGGTAALVQGSAVAKLDYALLRVREDVTAALGLKAIACDAQVKPVEKQGITILQHPGGGALMVATDENGVTGVYTDVGTVQYVSRAQAGSSGSPCFDDDKRLVALHHAERQKALGSTREGMLMSAIVPEIAQWLK